MTKVAIVTGAARRIGAAITTYLHSHDYDVIIHYRDSQQEASQLAHKLNAIRTNSASIVQADLTKQQDITHITHHIASQYPRLDLLVNNASCFFPTPLTQVNDQAWDTLFNANAKAPLMLSIALKDMLAKHAGAIVNILDIHQTKPLRDYVVYTASKAALGMITKSLAKELAPAIRVNAVSPGAILWPEDTAEIDSGVKDKIIHQTLLKRSGEAIDIAQAVYYLAEMPFVTGQTIAVDGGRVLSHA